MHSDGGPEFINSIFKEIQEILNVERSVTPAYHPNFNGACERVNQTIQKIIQRHRTLRSKYEWDELLPYAICAYNLSVHTTTNFPPFVLFFGRPFLNPEAPPYQPIEFPKYTIDMDTYLQNFRELWSEIVNEAVENSDEARQKFKNYFDKSNKTIPSKFKVGDNVMLLPPKLKPQLARDKTKPKATGPYTIIEIGNATAKIRMLNKKNRGVTLDNADDKFELRVTLDRLVKVPKFIQWNRGINKSVDPNNNSVSVNNNGHCPFVNISSISLIDKSVPFNIEILIHKNDLRSFLAYNNAILKADTSRDHLLVIS